jgi:TM2 domain-containing membrane protein YozV
MRGEVIRQPITNWMRKETALLYWIIVIIVILIILGFVFGRGRMF